MGSCFGACHARAVLFPQLEASDQDVVEIEGAVDRIRDGHALSGLSERQRQGLLHMVQWTRSEAGRYEGTQEAKTQIGEKSCFLWNTR